MWDNVMGIGNLLAWALAAFAFYSNNTESIKERIAVVETKVQQEMIGYTNLQTAIGQRLERIEQRLDNVLDGKGRH